MWCAYPELDNRKKLAGLLAMGMTREDIAKFVGCSLSSVDTALRQHKLSSSTRERCKNCGSFYPEEFGIGFCVEKERLVGSMAMCEMFVWREKEGE